MKHGTLTFIDNSNHAYMYTRYGCLPSLLSFSLYYFVLPLRVLMGLGSGESSDSVDESVSLPVSTIECSSGVMSGPERCLSSVLNFIRDVVALSTRLPTRRAVYM